MIVSAKVTNYTISPGNRCGLGLQHPDVGLWRSGAICRDLVDCHYRQSAVAKLLSDLYGAAQPVRTKRNPVLQPPRRVGHLREVRSSPA